MKAISLSVHKMQNEFSILTPPNFRKIKMRLRLDPRVTYITCTIEFQSKQDPLSLGNKTKNTNKTDKSYHITD